MAPAKSRKEVVVKLFFTRFKICGSVTVVARVWNPKPVVSLPSVRALPRLGGQGKAE